MTVMVMMMVSILTSAISASCSFYSYIPHFPSITSFSFLHYDQRLFTSPVRYRLRGQSQNFLFGSEYGYGTPSLCCCSLSVIMMMMMMSILTSAAAISAPCSFYSYTPYHLLLPSPSLTISLYPTTILACYIG